MNTQGQQFVGAREFRIGVIAVLAVVVLASAAYFFGTALRADTSASVAPSLAANPQADFYAALNNAAAASRSASLAANPQADFYAALNNAAAAPSAGLSAADYAAKHGIPAASAR